LESKDANIQRLTQRNENQKVTENESSDDYSSHSTKHKHKNQMKKRTKKMKIPTESAQVFYAPTYGITQQQHIQQLQQLQQMQQLQQLQQQQSMPYYIQPQQQPQPQSHYTSQIYPVLASPIPDEQFMDQSISNSRNDTTESDAIIVRKRKHKRRLSFADQLLRVGMNVSSEYPSYPPPTQHGILSDTQMRHMIATGDPTRQQINQLTIQPHAPMLYSNNVTQYSPFASPSPTDALSPLAVQQQHMFQQMAQQRYSSPSVYSPPKSVYSPVPPFTQSHHSRHVSPLSFNQQSYDIRPPIDVRKRSETRLEKKKEKQKQRLKKRHFSKGKKVSDEESEEEIEITEDEEKQDEEITTKSGGSNSQRYGKKYFRNPNIINTRNSAGYYSSNRQSQISFSSSKYGSRLSVPGTQSNLQAASPSPGVFFYLLCTLLLLFL